MQVDNPIICRSGNLDMMPLCSVRRGKVKRPVFDICIKGKCGPYKAALAVSPAQVLTYEVEAEINLTTGSKQCLLDSPIQHWPIEFDFW